MKSRRCDNNACEITRDRYAIAPPSRRLALISAFRTDKTIAGRHSPLVLPAPCPPPNLVPPSCSQFVWLPQKCWKLAEFSIEHKAKSLLVVGQQSQEGWEGCSICLVSWSKGLRGGERGHCLLLLLWSAAVGCEAAAEVCVHSRLSAFYDLLIQKPTENVVKKSGNDRLEVTLQELNKGILSTRK